MSEAESKPDPQTRIAEALEEIATQLKRLNENQEASLSEAEIDEAIKKSGAPLPEVLP